MIGGAQISDIRVWVGRDAQLATLERVLPTLKVLVLLGQGGIGKTSLAVKLLDAIGVDLENATLRQSCPFDGALVFNAKGGRSFDEVAQVLLTAFGQADAELETVDRQIDGILAGLQRQRWLLLFDNLEDLLYPATHPQAGRSIAGDWGKLLNALVMIKHQSCIILTSREMPKDLADSRTPNGAINRTLVRVEMVKGIEAKAGAELLRESGLSDGEADLCWVAEQVGGHPFVLTQLAAYAMAELDGQLCGYVRKHPELLTEDAKPILQLQRSRQEASAQELLNRMSVLQRAADCRGLTFLRLYEDEWLQDNRLALASVSGEPMDFSEAEKRQTRKRVETLVESSLVQKRYDPYQHQHFYDLHPLVAKFLQEDYSHELPSLLRRVGDFYQTPIQLAALAMQELAQIVQAPILFAVHLGDTQEASYLAMMLMRSMMAANQTELILQTATATGVNQIDTLLGFGAVQESIGNWGEAETYFQEALNLATAEFDHERIGQALGGLGQIERNRGNWDAAETLFRRCLEVEEELGDRSGMASSWGVLGDIESNRGNWDAAETLCRRSLKLREELGDRSGMASSWGVLGDIESNRGNWDAAETLYRRSLKLREELGDRSGIATSIGCLGETELGRGNLDGAEILLNDALVQMQTLGMTWHIAETNFDLAQLHRQRGNLDCAQQHYTTAHQLFTRLGALKDLERIEKEWAE